MQKLLSVTCIALVAFGAAACGREESSPSPPTTSEAAAAEGSSVPNYLTQLDSIKVRADDARSDYHNAALGEPTLQAARDLAEIAGEVADDLEELEPPASHAQMHARMIETFREHQTAIDGVLAREPVSTERLGNVIRKHWKILDDLHDRMLVTSG